METFDVSKLNALAFEAINQKGNGDMDRYIYQDGQGLGSFFGSLMKRALPLLGKTIKGAAFFKCGFAIRAAPFIVFPRRGSALFIKLPKKDPNP